MNIKIYDLVLYVRSINCLTIVLRCWISYVRHLFTIETTPNNLIYICNHVQHNLHMIMSEGWTRPGYGNDNAHHNATKIYSEGFHAAE